MNKLNTKNQEELSRINNEIDAPEVRLVGDNVSVGVYKTSIALDIANKLGLDLVEISQKSNPPVCKIIDYLKYKYEQKKKQKEIKANSQRVVVKEIRLTPTTDDHDFNFKLNHAIKFLQDGAKLKIFVNFNRSNIQAKHRGEALLLKFASELEKYAKVDKLPTPEDKKQTSAFKMLLFMSPKSSKN